MLLSVMKISIMLVFFEQNAEF